MDQKWEMKDIEDTTNVRQKREWKDFQRITGWKTKDFEDTTNVGQRMENERL